MIAKPMIWRKLINKAEIAEKEEIRKKSIFTSLKTLPNYAYTQETHRSRYVKGDKATKGSMSVSRTERCPETRCKQR